MLVKTLDNKEVYWQLEKKKKIPDEYQSNLHLKCRTLLQELFPTLLILEEIPVPISRFDTLYFDFFLPLIKLVIEVQGQQHIEYSQFFHKSKGDFWGYKKRDRYKQEWCELNNIKLIHLRYDEDIEDWKEKITQ